MGKTRLLMEICHRMRAAGWRAGFLHITASLTAEQLHLLRDGAEGVFAVVDYAETRALAVRTLVEAALESEVRIRIVLLARAVADWWYGLQLERGVVGDFFNGPTVTRHDLPPLAADEPARQAAFRHAAASYAAALGTSPLHCEAGRELLTAPYYERVLFIHIGALAALGGSVVEGERGLLDFALRREESFWDAGVRAAGLPLLAGRPIRQAAALATIAGRATTFDDAVRLLAQVPLLSGQAAAVVGQVADLFHRLYPATSWLEGVQPDLLGEHLVARAVEDDPALLGVWRTLIRSVPLDEEQQLHGLTVLTRLAQREPDKEEWLVRVISEDPGSLLSKALEVAVESGEPMARALQLALGTTNPGLAELQSLFVGIPPYTVTLLSLALTVDQQVLKGVTEPKDSDARYLRATVLVDYAERLVEADRPADALPHAAEAVDWWRSLDSDPKQLTNALRVLALCQRSADRAVEAVATAAELVRFTEEHRSVLPWITLPQAVHSWGIALQAAGQIDSAIAASTRSIKLWHELQATLGPQFEHNLGRKIGADRVHVFMGFPEELTESFYVVQPTDGRDAMVVSREDFVVLDPRRPRPATVRLGLALSLNSRAVALSQGKQYEQALSDEQGAVQILRDLANADPDAHAPHLGTALLVAVECLVELGRCDEALPYAAEAIDALRAAAAAQTSYHWKNMVRVQARLCNALIEYGRLDEAIINFRNLVAMAAARMPNEGAVLASALGNDLERIAEHCTFSAEHCVFSAEMWGLVVECRRLTVKDEVDGVKRLCGALTEYATSLHRAGDPSAALPVAEEAVELSLRWAGLTGDVTYPATALHGLARRLSALDRVEEACEVQLDAVRRLVTAVPADQARYAMGTSSALNNYFSYVARVGRPIGLPPEAYPAFEMALAACWEETDERNLSVLATTAFLLVSERARVREPEPTRRLHRALIDFARAHSKDRSVRTARAMVGWNVVMCHVDADRLAWAREAYDDLAALAAECPSDTVVVVEHAKCAAELIQAYHDRDDVEELRALARGAEGSLRSPEYLQARQRDLGEEAGAFLHALDGLLTE